MIQGCVIFYNDGPELLKRCLLSLKGKVDTILAIDGRWNGFKAPTTNSDDGCFEVAQDIADIVLTPKEPWYNQIAKRNALLTLDNPNDFYLMLDADEYLEGYIDNNVLNGDFYAIKIVTEGEDSDNQVRLFRNLEGLKYKKKHSWLWLKNQIVNQDALNSDFPKLESLKIFHTPDSRPEERQIQDKEYTTNRKEPEDLPSHLRIPKVQVVPRNLRQTHVFTKLTKVKCLSGSYNGFDLDHSFIVFNEGDELLVTKEKAEQLNLSVQGVEKLNVNEIEL